MHWSTALWLQKHIPMSKPKMCLLWQNMQCLGGAFLLGSFRYTPEMIAPPLDVAIKFCVTYESNHIIPTIHHSSSQATPTWYFLAFLYSSKWDITETIWARRCLIEVTRREQVFSAVVWQLYILSLLVSYFSLFLGQWSFNLQYLQYYLNTK
jgi:hypothetical protein